ncbi:transcription factor bHLH115-like isoform X1 [Rhododendron vialii]|uniref:transcription factor bHLH115-like isoform X1 n=1 Tax=Rhododendron vialii TaxID=182163 RepID=UPI00265E824D|nr:transcription factor bHLH115-like isoform X1 [Rhododendron vialii]
MVNPEENSNWLVDYGVIENIPVPGGDLPSLEPGFDWCPDALAGSTGLSVDFADSFGNLDGIKECGSRKRMRPESCSSSDSKACREKMRRDRLNERFLELSLILEPGRKPKVDKAVILSDAVQTLTQLRDEAQKLKESSDSLQEKINELKAEKNELRDEKQKLKVEKEKLEQQLKAMSSQPAFFPYPSGIPTPFGAPGQVVGSKLVPFMGYPGVPMWQFMPPTAVDTSEDHTLRPPVA